jgi:hypothetical protein
VLNNYIPFHKADDDHRSVPEGKTTHAFVDVYKKIFKIKIER